MPREMFIWLSLITGQRLRYLHSDGTKTSTSGMSDYIESLFFAMGRRRSTAVMGWHLDCNGSSHRPTVFNAHQETCHGWANGHCSSLLHDTWYLWCVPYEGISRSHECHWVSHHQSLIFLWRGCIHRAPRWHTSACHFWVSSEVDIMFQSMMVSGRRHTFNNMYHSRNPEGGGVPGRSIVKPFGRDTFHCSFALPLPIGHCSWCFMSMATL